MAWERRRKGWFYYRSYRDPTTGQVRKQYLGAGPGAEEAARQDAARRSEKAAQRSAKLDVQRRYEAAQRMLLALSQECETVVRAALAEAGYYQHNRGEWRRYARNHDK